MTKSTAVPLALALCALSTASGCATITGTVTGVLTGMVDAPAQVYRTHREEFAEDPIWWAPNIILFVPLGAVIGPIAGFCKGVALDAQWVTGKQEYGPVFFSYGDPSIWRPYTIHW